MEILSRLIQLRGLLKKDDVSASHFLAESLEVFDNLNSLQRQFILATIDSELETSESFGLKLTDEEQYREKFAFLTLFNARIKYIVQYSRLTGIDANIAYSRTHSLLLEELSSFLGDISLKYFIQFSQRGDLEVKSKYNIHLESTLSAILRGFWNGTK